MTTTPSHLHRLIIAAFDENDLRTLCFTLSIPYDALPSQGTAAAALAPLRLCGTGVARELILYLGRRRRFGELLAALQGSRMGMFDAVEGVG
jgi:hypothetical protein